MNVKEIDKTAYLSWSDVEYACELLSRKILQSTPNTTYDAIAVSYTHLTLPTTSRV